MPWTREAARRAGTVHVIGTFEETVAAEAAVNRGEMPARPYVLVGQQHLADPSRSEGDVHPLWAYAHVPHGFGGDATEAILAQLERFAPGVRERIVGQAVRTPADFERENENYIGGDIVNGANTPVQVLMRPRIAIDPYATGIPGVVICSAASPPGRRGARHVRSERGAVGAAVPQALAAKRPGAILDRTPAGVVQLVRTPACHAGGRRFESGRSR